MAQRSKEEKYAIVERLIASEEWQFLKQDLEEQIKQKAMEITGHFGSGATNMTYLHHGIKEGLQFCIDRPQEIKKECESFFKKVNRQIRQF